MTMIHTDPERPFVDAASLPQPGIRDDDDRLDDERNGHPFRDSEAAEIVHDFRNTLAAISMLSQFMLKDLPEGSPLREVACDVRLACKDALALCGRLLTASRDTGDFDQPTDLANLVTGMTAQLRTCIPPGSVLRFELAAEILRPNFDPVALRQIVMNLVRNAAEALGDRPGVVTIGTGWIEIDAAGLPDPSGSGGPRRGRHLCLSVADTGCGFDEETRTHMLERSFTTKTNGHGLGLASVRRIAAAHRADILIDSRVGAGTTVRVVFAETAAGSPRGSEEKSRA
ncbi:MAG: ATP-binding protein [Planctomycetales bacterium]